MFKALHACMCTCVIVGLCVFARATFIYDAIYYRTLLKSVVTPVGSDVGCVQRPMTIERSSTCVFLCAVTIQTRSMHGHTCTAWIERSTITNSFTRSQYLRAHPSNRQLQTDSSSMQATVSSDRWYIYIIAQC